MPLAQDVIAGLFVGSPFGEVVGGVAFAFPVGEVGPGKCKVLAGTKWPVRAVLVQGAGLATYDGPVSAQPMLHGHHGKVDSCVEGRAIVGI
jgi:hypothetical protein